MRKITEAKVIYYIESSEIGTVPTHDDQFKPATFDSPKKAKEFIKDLMTYPSFYGYDLTKGSYFQIYTKLNDEDVESVGRKIFVK
jgi:hypothetical protein